jgi:hypothetical protein
MNRIPPSNYPASSSSQPAGNALAVTPADSDMAVISRAIYVGVSGNLTVKMAGSENIVTFTAVPAGSLLPIRVTQVRATDTTATNIVALY